MNTPHSPQPWWRRAAQFVRDRWSPSVAGYLVLLLAVASAFYVQGHDRAAGRKQVCRAILEDRRLVRDVVDLAFDSTITVDPSTLPPPLRDLLEQSRRETEAKKSLIGKRLSRRVDLCVRVGITETVKLSIADQLPANTAIVKVTRPTPP